MSDFLASRACIPDALPLVWGHHALPDRALLLGSMRISVTEIVRADRPDQIIAAEIYAILEDARDQLIAPTFPVHDLPEGWFG